MCPEAVLQSELSSPPGTSSTDRSQSLALTVHEQLDQICVEFEDFWKAGQRPELESFLKRAEPPYREFLLKELLLLDLWYRQKRGEKPVAVDYLGPFPHDAGTIEAVFRDASPEAAAAGHDPPGFSSVSSAVDRGKSIEGQQPVGLVSLGDFIESLVRSQLMTRAEIDGFLAALPREVTPKDGRDLARELSRSGRLTRLQLQAVYQGKSRNLFLGKYVILDRLGRGGMGQVYKARQRTMNRVVAIKVLPPMVAKSREAVRRFHREMTTLGRLSHPNIVTAYDADVENGVHFLAMEYVEGKDLAALVKERGPLSVALAVACIRQAARGLGYAHTQGVVHRDIKPANLLLSPNGTLRVLDLGLAHVEALRADDDSAHQGLTQTGQVMGTFDFMAPEQAFDTRTADARSDIYSLGCTLYFLFVGHAPFPSGTLGQKLLAHREQPVPSLRAERGDVPEGLDRAFQKMLAKDPDERQQSMAELLDDLADREELTTASPLLATTTGEALRDTVAEHAQEDGLSFLAEDIPILQSPPLVIPRRVRTAMPLATRFRRSTMHVMVALAAASFMVLAGIVIKIMTPEGTVIVEVNVSDATIFVSDYQGTLVLERQASQETVSLELEPGGYHIRVEQDGKLLLAQNLALEARAQIKIDVPLEDEPGGKDGPPSSRPLAGIDLLSLIDVQRDTYLGQCTREGTSLVTSGAIVQIPYVPPEEYEFLAVVRQVSGYANCLLGIVVGGRQCLAVFDGFPPECMSGLQVCDGMQLPDCKEVHRGRVIPPDVPVALRCRVRKQDSERYDVRMFCEDREIFKWQGEASQLEIERYRAPAVKDVLFFASDSGFQVSKLQVTPLSGQGGRAAFASGASADRQVAERVLWKGGGVRISVDGRPPIRLEGTLDLPSAFNLVGIEPPQRIGDVRLDIVSTPTFAALAGLESLDLSHTLIQHGDTQHLAGLPRLAKLNLAFTNIGDESLQRLRACTGLRRLVLAGTPISSDGMKHLAELQSLEELDLRGTSVSDTGLESVKGLNRLRTLLLDGTAVTDAGLEHLCSLTGLTRLSLFNTSISDAGLAQLSRMQGLKDVCLVGTQVTQSGIKSLRQSIPQCRLESDVEGKLELLHVINPDRPCLGYPRWRFMDNVIVSPKCLGPSCLQIPYAPPAEYDLVIVARRRSGKDAMGIGLIVSGRPCTLTLDGWQGEVSGLERIDGQGCDANESTIRTTVFVPGVTTRIGVSVRKAAVTVTRDGLPLIKWSGDPARLSPFNEWGMPRTDLLWIASWGEGFCTESFGSFEIESFLITPIEGTGRWVELGPNRTNDEAEIANRLVEMGCEVRVTTNGISGQNVTVRERLPQRPLWIEHFQGTLANQSMGMIGGLTRLTYLDLLCSPIDDSGLAHVANLRNLEFLWLTGAPITDTGLASLSGLEKLTNLTLRGTRITDTGLAQLAELKNLGILSLDDTAITDVGLEHLHALPKLRELHIERTKVTAEGVRRFREAAPQVALFTSTDEKN